MKAALLYSLATLSMWAQVPAQAPPAPSDDTPLFRTGTLLVQVDVVVRDGKGPILGLTKDDFQVRDNGRKQDITIFSVREAKSRPAALVTAPAPSGGPQVVANRPELTGGEPVTATVILIDRLNTDWPDQVYGQDKTLAYLQRAAPSEHIAIFTLNSRLNKVHDLSKDREALQQALKKTWGQISAIDNEAGPDAFIKLQRKRELTTAALEQVATFLRGMPGRKKLVWMSSSFPLFFQQEEGAGIKTNRTLDSTDQIVKAARLLNDANTAVYPIDPRGLTGGFSFSDEGFNTMDRLADITGGKAFYGRNDVDQGIAEAIDFTEVTYTLGFYSPGDRPKESHTLEVNVARRGAQTIYRHSYLPEIKTSPVSENRAVRTLDEWLQRPLEATEIPLGAIARRIANRPGSYAVRMTIDVSAVAMEQKNGRWRGTLDIAISPDLKGKVKGLHQVVKLSLTEAEFVTVITNGLTLDNVYQALDAKGVPLATQVHVAVIDRSTGRAGSVRIPLEGLPAVTAK